MVKYFIAILSISLLGTLSAMESSLSHLDKQKHGNEKIIDLLLAKGAQVDSHLGVDKTGLTPLMFAAARKHGNEEIIKTLLGEDITLQVQDDAPATTCLLFVAAIGGDEAYLKDQAAQGVALDVMSPGTNKTLVHHAAESNHPGVIALVLEKHPTLLNAEDVDGNTALDRAVLYGSKESIKKLFVKGARRGSAWHTHTDYEMQREAAFIRSLASNAAIDRNNLRLGIDNDGVQPMDLEDRNERDTSEPSSLQTTHDLYGGGSSDNDDLYQ